MDYRLLTTAQAASLLGCHADTLRRWRKQGTGPAFVRLGRPIRYSLDALRAFVEARTERFDIQMAHPPSQEGKHL